MMRREYVRRHSKAARWAIPPAVFSPVLASMAILSHRFGLLSEQNFILVLLAALGLAVTGGLLAMLGLRSLWREAAIGGRRSALALLICMPVLVPAAVAAWLAQTTAPLSDISTDTQDPPHFSTQTALGPGMNVNEPPRLNAVLQKQFYPSVTGRRYQLSADGIAAQVSAIVAQSGWIAATRRPVSQSNGEWTIEATVTTAILGFKDDVVIRVTDEGESTYVDMRSASRFGAADLGANARRIGLFMNDLDMRIQSAVPG